MHIGRPARCSVADDNNCFRCSDSARFPSFRPLLVLNHIPFARHLGFVFAPNVQLVAAIIILPISSEHTTRRKKNIIAIRLSELEASSLMHSFGLGDGNENWMGLVATWAAPAVHLLRQDVMSCVRSSRASRSDLTTLGPNARDCHSRSRRSLLPDGNCNAKGLAHQVERNIHI